MKEKVPLVKTIPEKCKMCYTCIRDCPAKAIRVINGQAEVVPERCISCGHCLTVCSQNAKQYYNSIPDVLSLLKGKEKKAVILAPSFPAAFEGMDYKKLVGMLKKLGFDYVCEVAVGADLVAYEYKKLINNHPNETFIATTCPGIVSFVERYYPDLIKNLAPIVSPMVATARALKIIYGEKLKIVFIGPCLAKKGEAYNSNIDKKSSNIESVLTFQELEQFFIEQSITPENVTSVDFDPPKPAYGALFPVHGGMLQAADIKIDLLNSDVFLADGKEDFANTLFEISKSNYNIGLVEILCCKGCIMGPCINSDKSYIAKKTIISEYVNKRVKPEDHDKSFALYTELIENSGLDMSTSFKAKDIEKIIPEEKEIKKILERMYKFTPQDELNCRACGYNTCRDHARAIYLGLAENEMCLPFMIDKLKKSLNELNDSQEKLESTKAALFNAEKLASLGELSAGIAHEINNPLGVILLNAHMLLEDLVADNCEDCYQEDMKLIIDQANRCKTIARGLLNFARKNKLFLAPTNIYELITDSLKSIIKPANIDITVVNNCTSPIAEVQGDKIIQIMVNLLSNAIDAIETPKGNINIDLSDTEESVIILVKDSGCGIPQKNRSKIFEPLFTTKQIGKGTGLGLAVSYGIVKTHNGEISVSSNDNPANGPTWTEFRIVLPKKEKNT